MPWAGCPAHAPDTCRASPGVSRSCARVATDLFLAASAWPSESLARVVPPSCGRGIDPAPSPEHDREDLIVRLPEWRPRDPAHRLVPAFSVLGDSAHGFRFEMSVLSAGAWSPWVGGATVGRARFPDVVTRSEPLVCEVDEFIASPGAERIRLVLRVTGGDPAAPFASPWFVSLSAWSPAATDGLVPGGGARLVVPPFSQMEEEAAIRNRICSPASVAMVLAYYGARVAMVDLARDIFHPELDLYGVWPAAVRAAGRRGGAGYFPRLPAWSAAAWGPWQGRPGIAAGRLRARGVAGAAPAAEWGQRPGPARYE